MTGFFVFLSLLVFALCDGVCENELKEKSFAECPLTTNPRDFIRDVQRLNYPVWLSKSSLDGLVAHIVKALEGHTFEGFSNDRILKRLKKLHKERKKEVETCFKDRVILFHKLCLESMANATKTNELQDEQASLYCYATLLVRKWQAMELDTAMLRFSCLGVTQSVRSCILASEHLKEEIAKLKFTSELNQENWGKFLSLQEQVKEISNHLDSILYAPDSKCNLAKPTEINAYACVGKAEVLLHQSQDVKDIRKAFEYFAASCRESAQMHGDPRGCERLIDLVQFGSRGVIPNYTLSEKDTIASMLEIGCEQGSSKCCRYYSMYLRAAGNAEESNAALTRAANLPFVFPKVYQDLCNYHSSGIVGFETSKEIVKDTLLKACETTFTACGYYGWTIDKGDKTDIDKKNALHYYELGCKHGENFACMYYFFLLSALKKTPEKPVTPFDPIPPFADADVGKDENEFYEDMGALEGDERKEMAYWVLEYFKDKTVAK